uniref:Uncharacterized protein n=1 Tax=Rhipicephalus appendiculatus TaxID=34631 RepID=A0A131YFC4_RHIAP
MCSGLSETTFQYQSEFSNLSKKANHVHILSQIVYRIKIMSIIIKTNKFNFNMLLCVTVVWQISKWLNYEMSQSLIIGKVQLKLDEHFVVF